MPLKFYTTAMTQLSELRDRLIMLKCDIRNLEMKGAIVPYPAPFILDRSTSKGHTYYRKRERDAEGKPGKSEPIDKKEYDDLKKQIERGRELSKLQKQLDKVAKQIQRIENRIARLGGSLDDRPRNYFSDRPRNYSELYFEDD